MAYSSKDFSLVSSRPKAEIPSCLVHHQVESTGLANAFSKERGHGVAVVDLPSKTISMTIGHLEPGKNTRKHRHNYETMILILEGKGESEIEGETVSWQAGDAIYIPPWAWHCHRNTSSSHQARYLACENAPLLQNLGNIAIREEQ